MTPKPHPEDMSKWSKEDFANQRTDNSTNQKCETCSILGKYSNGFCVKHGRIQSDTKLDKAIESLVEDYGNALVALGKEEPDTKLQPGEEFIGDWITSDTIARVLISMEEFTEWVESHPAEAKYIVLVAQDKDGVYRNVKLEDF